MELEANGEDKNRTGVHFAFTVMGKHFGYASNKSFTLWSLRTGKIKLKINEDSPFKIIQHDFLICIGNDLTCKIMKFVNEEIIISFKIRGIESISEILDARCSEEMDSLVYVIKKGIIRYVFKSGEFKGVQQFKS